MLEICCYSLQSVLNANAGNANRIELCADIASGGTTPSAALIEQTVAISSIPVYVMIRPRGGDFFYTKNEFQLMLGDIEFAKSMGVEGVVFGCLSNDGFVDVEKIKLLMEVAKPLQTTFHRAVDMCNDILLATRQIAELQVNNILTSGGCNTAVQGLTNIISMMEAAGSKTQIIAASAVSDSNMELLYNKGIRNFHSSASAFIDSKMKFKNPHISMNNQGSMDEFKIQEASLQKIVRMSEELKKLVL